MFALHAASHVLPGGRLPPVSARVSRGRLAAAATASTALSAVCVSLLPAQAATAAAPAAPALARVTAASASLAGSVVSRTYQPSTAAIANPERGFYHYTETHSRVDGSGYSPLDPTVATRWRTVDGVTLVYRIFYLERFVGSDQLDPAYLGQLQSDLAAARSAGVKLVVRFAYSADTSQDAPPERVVAHIRQLAPVLNANRDVVATLQAGFVGQWGEWYYSERFASDPQRPWALTDTDWQKRGMVLHALLEATDPSIVVQVRYADIKQRLLAGAPSAIAERVGFHDDCFLASNDDYGTFKSSGDYAWVSDQTRTVPMGGETCRVNAPRSLWPSASADLAAYHWSYLNADYESNVLASWGTSGVEEARRRLGYRLRLTRATFQDTAAAGGPVQVQLSLVNDGFAAPFRSRPVRVVFRGPAGDVARDVPVDVRTLAPGQESTFSVTVPAPLRADSYGLYLALPDPSPSLAGRPAYSIQLANQGTWNAVTGDNDLGASITVTGPGGS